MKQARRITQIVFFAFFLYLFIQTEYKGSNELGLPVKIFLDLDPLVSIATILAAHKVETLFLLSIPVLLTAVLAGRVFCGWVCPLGTINTFFGGVKMRHSRLNYSGMHHPRLLRLKYYILAFVLVAAVFGWNAAGYLDPISLTVRSLAIGFNPAVNRMVRSALVFVYDLGVPALSPAADALLARLTGTLLAFEQPMFGQVMLIGTIFAVIVALNFVAPRFWCRYLCPLGALLGLIGTKQMLARVDVRGETCVSCSRCNLTCQGDASPFPAGNWASRECVVCFNCTESCKVDAVSIHPTTRRTGKGNVDLRRRWLLASGLGALAAAPMISTGAHGKRPDPMLIRPPGALPEEQFLRTCVKCGECMKVCLTNGLQPTLLQAGIEGLWSPMLVPTLGYCEYNCNLCLQVCPTGAIRHLPLEQKREIKIGLANFDRNRCIPWAHNRNCGVCEEHCPVPDKAIKFLVEETVRPDGRKIKLKKPYVTPKLCIGCGACENKCVYSDRPAVFVTSTNESRSEENRVFF